MSESGLFELWREKPLTEFLDNYGVPYEILGEEPANQLIIGGADHGRSCTLIIAASGDPKRWIYVRTDLGKRLMVHTACKAVKLLPAAK